MLNWLRRLLSHLPYRRHPAYLAPPQDVLLLTLEGGPGTGKTILLRRLQHNADRLGISIIRIMDENEGTPEHNASPHAIIRVNTSPDAMRKAGDFPYA